MLSLPWLLTAAATAATWTVPTDFPTIGAAAAAAASGDVIRILPGTYVERVRVTKSLTFEGEPGTVWVSTFGEYEALEIENATVTVSGIQFASRNRSRSIDVLTGATVVVEDCTLTSGESEDGGGIRARFGTSLVVRRTTFLSNHARDDGGGIFAEGMGSLEVVDSTFLDCSAPDGGGLNLLDDPDVELTRVWLEDNFANQDGAGFLAVDSAVTLSRSMLCANVAADDGAAIDLEGATLAAVGNIFLLGNAGAEGGAIDSNTYSAILSTNNHFVGNQGSDLGSAIRGSSHTSVNDLIAYNGAGTTVHDVPGASLSYIAFFGNDLADTTAAVPTDVVLTDPLLRGWPAQTCTTDLAPLEASPLVNAGSPAILDTDGSVSDIGAFGGPTPFAAVPPPDNDLDGDGAEAAVDCDDMDPSSHPGALEICDGRDNDCDGVVPANEVDADGDGYLACGDDCNDGAASVHPGATEVVADGVDQDCNGSERCYDDADGDGFGTTTVIDSADADCTDAGESSNSNDICPGGNDNVDADSDGIPDFCDACPNDSANDADGDGVCGDVDVCPGYNDNDDSDGDGIPNGCDACVSLSDADADGVPDDCDLCPGSDDNVDTDADGVADGCDACPVDNPNDTDGDGVCDVDDVCDGGDDTVDSDSDGIPDDCDSTPIDTGTAPTEPTEPTDTGTGPGPIDTGTGPGPIDTAPPEDIDRDGDGIPDSVDPDPDNAGGDGPAVAPAPTYGCGCDQGSPLGAVPMLGLLGLVLRRRSERS